MCRFRGTAIGGMGRRCGKVQYRPPPADPEISCLFQPPFQLQCPVAALEAQTLLMAGTAVEQAAVLESPMGERGSGAPPYALHAPIAGRYHFGCNEGSGMSRGRRLSGWC